MKTKNCFLKKHSVKIYFSVALFSMLTACEPPITFNEPQPSNTSNLDKFPNSLQGEYISTINNSKLNIGEKTIIQFYEIEEKISKNNLIDLKLTNDTLIDLKTNKKYPTKQQGDSLAFTIKGLDTLCLLNDNDVLKKYKGYYFLNKKYTSGNWEVKKMELNKGQLTISRISVKEDIEKLKEIKELSSDTSALHNLSLTKKEFKKFIKNDGFSESDTYIKIK